MSTLSSAQASYLLDEVVSGVAIDSFATAPSKMALLYNLQGSSGRRERFSSVSGLSEFAEKNETQAAQEDAPVQQFQKTFVNKSYAKTVRVSRELIDDEEWGFFQDLGRQLGVGAQRKIESLAVEPFTDAFAGATYLAEDGLSICNNAHLNVDGGNSQDNYFASTSFTLPNVKTVRTAMKRYTDYRGNHIDVNPDMLILPPDLEQDGWEMARSLGRPDTANRADNFYNGMFNLVIWNYLSSATSWFMCDSALMKLNLMWFQRVPLEFYGDGDLFTGTRAIGGYFRSSHGVRDWRFLAGATA